MKNLLKFFMKREPKGIVNKLDLGTWENSKTDHEAEVFLPLH